MRYKEPFTLFQRKLASGKKVFYYAVYDDLGHRKQYSTACIKKADAKNFCYQLFKIGRLIPQKEETFSEYSRNWFIYDKCPYIQMRLLRGYSYSRSMADIKRSQLLRVIIPYFGKYKLSDITTGHIEDWMIKQQKKGYCNLTLKHYLSTLRLIFNEAYRKGDLSSNPGKAVKSPASNSKPRNTLNDSEVYKLFSDTDFESVWSGKSLYYLMNLTASQTGMRVGEIQALQWEHLHHDHILVKHSWDRNYGLKSTKSGKERIVPIRDNLYMKLLKLKSNQSSSGKYVFSAGDGSQPVDHKAVYKWTKRAFMAIGISEEQRAERKITFHSWRHYFNTKLLLKGVPENIVQEIIGHAGSKMTRNYTKVNIGDLLAIVKE